MARLLLSCCLAVCVVLGGCSSAIKPNPVRGPAPPYDYTIVDPLAATVVGTPQALAATVPTEINKDQFSLTVFPERKIPEVFWYAGKLAFSLVYQVDPAPLVFLIAGTGAGHDSTKSKYLQQGPVPGRLSRHLLTLAHLLGLYRLRIDHRRSRSRRGRCPRSLSGDEAGL